MGERVYNFAAGPSTLPLPVLERAQKEMLCYGDTGMSVMEMSHRSGMYLDIFNRAVAGLRDLMRIPDNYKVLFLQGGAMSQFAAVPMNLLQPGGSADYVLTGNFAKGAYKEAKKFGTVRVAATSEADNFAYIPGAFDFDPAANYVHITTNNTVYGTHYARIPDTGAVPLVADMSSNILGEEYDVSKFGVIYAGAQKNVGIAGVTVVIVRDDLLGRERPDTPATLCYKVQADNDSMINTPTTFGIYMAGLVFDWLKEQGGVAAMAQRNAEKAQLLYDVIDSGDFYRGAAREDARSLMNVTFVCKDDALNDLFVKQAAKKGMVNLKGHRAVGGIRASIYNAMPREGVQALADFMRAFAKENG